MFPKSNVGRFAARAQHDDTYSTIAQVIFRGLARPHFSGFRPLCLCPQKNTALVCGTKTKARTGGGKLRYLYPWFVQKAAEGKASYHTA